jgi:predicted metal-dependent hydrolase
MALPDNYILERKKIKHARIRVSENLSVRVLVPENFDNSDIENLLKKKQPWIDKNLSKFKGKTGIIKLNDDQILLFGNKYSYFYRSDIHNKIIVNQVHKTIQSKINLLEKEEQLKWYKRYAKRHITQRLAEISKKYKFKFNKVFIRDQRTKWGNCSTEKNLSFNWRLIKTPLFVIDYLIFHELVHTRTMNHTSKFWIELKSLYPEYQEAIKWLEKYGNNI